MKQAIHIIFLCIVFMAGMFTQAFIDREYIRETRDIHRELVIAEANIVLRMDGYEIYFSQTEHGEIALVHPYVPPKGERDEDI